MTAPTLLNSEEIVANLLKADGAVAAIVGSRVVSRSPSTTEEPWVRVSLIDPENRTPTREVEYLVGYYLQIDCYAGKDGGQAEAWALASAVRAALVAKPTLDSAVITDVEPLSMPRSPDDALSPTRERFILDVIVTMRPKP